MKLTMIALATAFALSSAAVASTSSVPPRWTAAQTSAQAFNWAATTADAHQYHGGPKSNYGAGE
jgi:hypothetical protein